MRTKIILPNLLVVLIVGLGAFFWLQRDLHGKATERMRARLAVTAELLRRSDALRGHELLADVTKQSMSKDITQAFAEADLKQEPGETPEQIDAKLRQMWFSRSVQAVETYSELWNVRTGKKPDIVFLTDRKGVVLARNITATACPTGRDVSDSMAVVGAALSGSTAYSLWMPATAGFGKDVVASATKCPMMNTGLVEIAAAPVIVDGDIAGVLVAGFDISDGVAAEKEALLGFDVAVAAGGRIYSSSLEGEPQRQALEKQLAVVAGDRAKAAISSGRPSDIFDLEIDGDDYLALVAPAPNANAADQISYVIMGSVSDNDFFTGSLVVLLILTVVGAVAVLAIGIVLAAHFMRPIMTIEEGLLKIINGEYEHRFDVKSAEVGGLGFRINQLIGVLTGEEDQTDEEEKR